MTLPYPTPFPTLPYPTLHPYLPYPTLHSIPTPPPSPTSTPTYVNIAGSWRPFPHLKACFLVPWNPGRFGTCGSFVTLWYIIGTLTLLSVSVQRGCVWFMATLSAPKSLLFWCHELRVVLLRCDSFVTLWYIFSLLTLWSLLVQRGYFWFMATLSAPKWLLFVAMDFW